MRCDETRPSCSKCIRSGWKCDGYEAHAPVAAQGTSKRVAARAPALSIASYAIPFRMPGSQQDRQIIHYFCVQGSCDIAGYLSSSFWSETVLQASHHDAAARHALVALSSLHLDYATSDEADQPRIEVLNQHGRALRALRKRVEAGGPDCTRTALICCILFYSFESTLGNNETAMIHLENGLKLLPNSHARNRDYHETSDLSDVSEVFERLDLQATIFDDSRRPVVLLRSEDELLQESQMFGTLQDARKALTRLQNQLFHFINNNLAFKDCPTNALPKNVLSEKDSLLKALVAWKAKFEPVDSVKSCPERNYHTSCGRKVLLIQWHLSRMLLDADFPHNEAVFGASPNEEAEKVLKLAGDVIMVTEEDRVPARVTKSPRRNFSSEGGLIAPLFVLGMKCSDQSICTMVAELLTRLRRREGLYDSQTMAAITRDLKLAQSQRTPGEPNASLEHTFATELDGFRGGMDHIADFVSSTTK